MGSFNDLIFPGFTLCHIQRRVEIADVKNFLDTHLGKYETKDNKPVEISCFRNNGGLSRSFVIEGILLPFNKIREKIIGQTIDQHALNRIESYHGVPIGMNGGKLEQVFGYDLNRQIMYSRGYQEPMTLLNRNLCIKQLGNMNRLQDILFFRGNISDFDPSLLGRCFKVNMVMGRRRQEEMRSTGIRNHVSIQYFYKLDALRDLFLLNRDPRFVRNGGCFFNKLKDLINGHLEFPITVDPVDILVRHDDEPTDFVEILKKYKYIPLAFLRSDIFDWSLLNTFDAYCGKCCTPYQFLGIDIDMGWLAARCNCNDATRTCWRGESFTRLTLGYDAKAAFNTFFDPTWKYKLVEVVEGCAASFTDIDHIVHSSLAAVEIEVIRERRNEAKFKAAVGSIEFARTLDSVTDANGVVKVRVHIRVRVQQSEWWEEKRLKKYAYINIIKKNHHSFDQVNDLNEMVNRAIRGKLYAVESANEEGHLFLDAVVMVEVGETFNDNEKVKVYVCRDSYELMSLRHTISTWQSTRNSRVAPVLGTLGKKLREFFHPQLDPKNNYLIAFVTVDRLLDFKLIRRNLNKSYVGVDIEKSILNNGLSVRTNISGRIFSIHYDGSVTRIGVVMRVAKGIKITEGDVCLRIWGIFEKEKITDGDELRTQRVLLDPEYQSWLPNDYEMEDSLKDWNETDMIYSFGTTDPNVPKFFEFYLTATPTNGKMANDGLYEFESMEDIISSWIEKPFFNAHSTLDMLIDNDQETPVVPHPRLDVFHLLKRVEIIGHMHDSQNEIIESILLNKLTVLDGFPGTGKKITSAFAVAATYCFQNDPIVVLTGNLYSLNYMYALIDRVFQRLKISDVRVVKVVPCKHEEKFKDDKSMLHNMLHKHPGWNDPKFQELIQKIKCEGMASLLKNELKTYDNYVLKFQKDVLKDADIIFMPFDVCSEPRILHLNQAFARVGRRLGSMFILDANLVKVSSFISCLALDPLRLVVVGDSMQLSPPKAPWTSHYACQDRSWLELAKASPLKKNARIFKELDVNLRIHPQIARLISCLGYNKKLISPSDLHDRTYQSLESLIVQFPELSQSQRLVGFSYPHTNMEVVANESLCNCMEENIIFRIFEKLRAAGINFQEITVASPYKEQVRSIEQRIERLNIADYRNAVIGTIDQISVTNNAIVILSLVRSVDMDFMKDIPYQKKILTAMSRANQVLFIVGDFGMMEKSAFFFYTKFVHLFNLFQGHLKIINELGEV